MYLSLYLRYASYGRHNQQARTALSPCNCGYKHPFCEEAQRRRRDQYTGMQDSGIRILVAQNITLNVHNLLNGPVWPITQHVQHMTKSHSSRRVSRSASRLSARKKKASSECHSAGSGQPHLGSDLRNACRTRREPRRIIRPNVRPADGSQALGLIFKLPVAPQLVEPGMVQPEDGVARARDAVLHLPADAAVAGAVRLALDAWPEGQKVGALHAGVDGGRRGALAHDVADASVDAMIRVIVARPDDVGVVRKGSVLDAALCAGAVAAEAVYRVEHDGFAVLACVELLLPVPDGIGQSLVGLGFLSCHADELTAGSRCSCTRCVGHPRNSGRTAGAKAKRIPRYISTPNRTSRPEHGGQTV
jgi:hypothetical protein